ncbi:MAG: glutathionylspermidine synthase family protein [Clostridia bacterium]|nr:glutathionylspermidine synthase family protein [Clostridia bacterium]
MNLIEIPESKYYDYRIKAIFNCYKWDPQYIDNNTLSKYVLLLTQEESEKLKTLTEKLDSETSTAEKYLNNHPKIAKKLKLPKELSEQIPNMQSYDESRNIRLARYDFHPSVDGEWVVTEVNSDVPGGFAESSLLPDLARKTIDMSNLSYVSFGEAMVESINHKLNKNGTIMMVHSTCYSDDRQVMQYMGERLEMEGYHIIYGATNHIKFSDKEAYSILDNYNCKIDLIFRFTSLEWFIKMRPRRWDGYFDTTTISCNHPICMYSQTKRFPLVFEDLQKAGINMDTWKKHSPETRAVTKEDLVYSSEDYIFKPVYGRAGENVSIKEACRGEEYKQIINDVKKHPGKYICQRKFISKPLYDNYGNRFHVCVGSFVIDGKHAGFYGRISPHPRIDSYAADIPILIEKDN